MSWLKNRRKFLMAIFLIVFFAIVGLVIINTIYKPHKSIQDREIKFSGTPVILIKEVNKDFTKWQDKAVQLTGKITSIDNLGFTLEDVVYCQTNTGTKLSQQKLNKTITIIGRVIGYDDLLEELKLDQTIIVN